MLNLLVPIQPLEGTEIGLAAVQRMVEKHDGPSLSSTLLDAEFRLQSGGTRYRPRNGACLDA
jgi:hypothetical protein